MKNQTICVLGGAGFVGTQLVSQLAAAGKNVKVLTRRREQSKELILLPTVEVVEADVNDEQVLLREFRGMDAVINLVGILHEITISRDDLPSARRGDFQRVHIELPRKVVHACAQAGVHRLLHMSALGAEPTARSAYQRSKGIGEALVREAGMQHSEHENWYLNGPKFIHGYGLNVTIFRPSVVFGNGDSFLTMFAALQKMLPLLPLAKADARFQPVYVGDVARAFVDSLDKLATFGKTYDLCGPEVYTLQELVRYVGTATGHQRTIVPLCDRLSYLQAWAMEFKPGKKLMTRDNYYAMGVDNVCVTGWPDSLDFEPTALEAVAPGYLRADSPRGRYDGYRGHARR
ncbi:MAG: complex I NDUFA9 subunit family protein [Thiobacillaceae bacterium]